MKNSVSSLLCPLLVLFFAADGCSRTSVIGTSGKLGPVDSDGDSTPVQPMPPEAPKLPSVIATSPGAGLIFNLPIAARERCCGHTDSEYASRAGLSVTAPRSKATTMARS